MMAAIPKQKKPARRSDLRSGPGPKNGSSRTPAIEKDREKSCTQHGENRNHQAEAHMSNAAASAAIAQAGNACCHRTASVPGDGTCSAGKAEDSVPELDSLVSATIGGSCATATRTCGAPQCEQKATPSSTPCPHLWQRCSIKLQKVALKVSHGAYLGRIHG